LQKIFLGAQLAILSEIYKKNRKIPPRSKNGRAHRFDRLLKPGQEIHKKSKKNKTFALHHVI
jgi:hypothetical protein